LRRLAAGGLAARIGHPQAIFATYGKGLYNNASHLVDFLRMLFGEIVAVRAVGEAKRAELSPFANDVELPFVATLASGSTAFIGALDFAKYREVGLDVWGDVGRLTILQEGLVVTHYARRANRGVRDAAEIASDEGRILPCPVERAFYDLYGNLAAALRGADRLWSSGESALRTENALAAVIRSARAGGVPVSP
jgi:predicted dehydrogenase